MRDDDVECLGGTVGTISLAVRTARGNPISGFWVIIERVS